MYDGFILREDGKIVAWLYLASTRELPVGEKFTEARFTILLDMENGFAEFGLAKETRPVPAEG
jgi:hypothetical protein